MQVSIYEAKTQFSKLVEAVERGEEVIVTRRNKPVVRLTPAAERPASRIGGLKGRKLKMGAGFDTAESSEQLADLFGVAQR